MKKDDNKKPEWSEIRKFPIVIFQSVRGPLMGHADPRCRRWSNALKRWVWGVDGIVRLWAPANVGMPDERHVMWMPLAFCEEVADVRVDSAAFFASHEVPELVRAGYEQYVLEFMQGAYKMKPLVADMGVDATPVVVKDPQMHEKEPTETLVLCGGCGKHVNADHPHAENCSAAF